ncbi:MAG: PEP-CTERM sorting domain-containing protein [Phycisphaerae bacterium]|jgi:hypothetical protein|nr:PEP-CTERM sorting domain-containing protein [Phycisphaerae bacterium]
MKREEERVSVRGLLLLTALLITWGALPAFADWEPGQPAVHYQLPDFSGWDVYSEWGDGPYYHGPDPDEDGYGAANDWTATVTAAVTDIHFWGSWKSDVVGTTGDIQLQIYSNDSTHYGFDQPGDVLWSRVIEPGQYEGKKYHEDDWELQGWYDPRYSDDNPYLQYHYPDHKGIYQYNIPNIEDAFVQQEGETYWLMISMNFEGCEWGWKTSETVEGNGSLFWDAYYSYSSYYPTCWYHPEVDWRWVQLQEGGWCSYDKEPLDLAFVITPEPATLLLLAVGAAAVLRKRRR